MLVAEGILKISVTTGSRIWKTQSKRSAAVEKCGLAKRSCINSKRWMSSNHFFSSELNFMQFTFKPKIIADPASINCDSVKI